MNKITIIGAGRVGEATAQLLAIKELAREIVLIDIREGAAAGAALDIQESAALFHFDTSVSGSTDMQLMVDSDLVIITAGVPRKPGMSRSDVLGTNLGVINGIVDCMQDLAGEAMLIMVTNPVDVLTYCAWRRCGWPKNRVLGLSGVLDAARMATFIALESGYATKDITAMVLGGHGDAMVPLPRYTCIKGIPVDHFLEQQAIDAIVDRTRQGGAEILALKQTSSAYDAPAAAITEMVSAIVHDRRQILPCVSLLDGEYGQTDIAMGVPVVIGDAGVEKVLQLNLSEAEAKHFAASAEQVRADIDSLNL
ncbi:MAG TPA: malate dehydrogenase [Gammaproteobacteria bacterium]|nr:malate dehydrogenase [Gammaproteobacteria bacterium]